MSVWPASDSFDAGATAYETSLFTGAYVRLLGWTSDPAYGSGGTGFTRTWDKRGVLFDAYFSVPGQHGQIVHPAVSTIGAALGANIGTSAMTGYAVRDLYAAEVDVAGSFRFRYDLPLSSSAWDFSFGIGARLTGGALTDAGTATTHNVGGDGYYFVAFGSAGNINVKYQLLRVNGGTVTRLAESHAGSTGGVLWPTWYQSNAIKRLRMTVHTNGATVELRCYAMVSPESEALVLTFDDSSASRRTSAGRCGFMATNEWTTGGIKRAVLVQHLAVNTYAGDVVLLDDWLRTDPTACAVVPGTFTTGLPTSGRSLMSSWYGDAHGVAGFASRISKSIDRLLFDSSSVDRTGWYLSQRQEDDGQTQDRIVDFEFATGGPGVAALTRKVGIAVRATATAAGSAPSACYLLTAELVEDTLISSINLFRVVGGVSTLIARKLSGVTFTRGVVYELRLLVQPFETVDPQNAWVRLRAYVDTVQIEMEHATSPVPGISIDTVGTVTDQASARVLSGLSAGIYIGSKAAATAHVYVDAWDEGDGAVDPDIDASYATIPVSAEGDGATGTFPVPYDWGIATTTDLGTLRHEHEDGGAYVAKARSIQRRTWKVGTSAATEDEVDDLQDFFDDHEGDAIPFSFVEPEDSATVLARFVGGELRIEKIDVGVYAWTVNLEEVSSG